MAVTKLLRIKESVGSNKASHLQKNIFYICQEAKTGGGIWIGGNAGTTPGMIYRTMMENKTLWGKEDGSQGFHYVLSFPPDCNVNEELAFQIAEEFCGELLHDDFYYAIAVHNDRPHMHVHITFDSVSKTDGMKFHSPKGDWKKRIQPITDKICEKYNLPTLEYDEERRGNNYGNWKHSEESKNDQADYFTQADIIRDDIDEAIHFSESYKEFISYMQNEGYKITRNGNFLSLLPSGAGRAYRTGRLGKGYSKDEIIQRIEDKKLAPEIEYRFKTYGNRVVMREVIYAKIVTNSQWKMTPFQKKFWKRWNNTYFIRKPGRLSQEEKNRNKQDIMEVHKLSAAISYMLDYDIGSVSDLSLRRDELIKEKEVVERKLSVAQTKYYKKQPFYLVGQCEKLEAEFIETPSGDLAKEIQNLINRIEKYCPYDEALEKRKKAKGEMDECRNVLKDNKKEIKIVDDIYRLYFQMEPPHLEVDFSKSEEYSDTKKKEKLVDSDKLSEKKRYHSSHEEPENKMKITINEKMFCESESDEYFISRIPHKKDLVYIPLKDCSLSSDGRMMTAWIYFDQKYTVYSTDERRSDVISGNELKHNYEDKTRKGVNRNGGLNR